MLPRPALGRPRLDDRMVLNGIPWKVRIGVPWKVRTGVARRDAPERYGSWTTLHTRFRRWAADGTFERMLRAAQATAYAAGDIDWPVSIDSTLVRAHQHAARTEKEGSTTRRPAGPGAARPARFIWSTTGSDARSRSP